MEKINSDQNGISLLLKLLLAVVLTAGVVFGASYYYFVILDEEEENLVSDYEKDSEEIVENTAVDIEAEKEIDIEAMIREYYQKLEDGDLKGAYAMKYKPEQSFATFKGWYGNVEYAEVDSLKKLSNCDYRFAVFLEENNGTKSEYRTVMRLTEGLLETISAYQVNTESLVLAAKWGDKSALVKDDGDKQRIYLNGKVIAEIEYEIYGDSKWNDVYKIEFAKNGKYLIWGLTGWEWSGLVVRHLESGKELKIDTPNDWGFSADMNYFYACQESGLHGGYMNIYYVPEMSVRNKLNTQGYVMAGCEYATSDSYVYKMVNSLDGGDIETFEYFFATDRVRKFNYN